MPARPEPGVRPADEGGARWRLLVRCAGLLVLVALFVRSRPLIASTAEALGSTSAPLFGAALVVYAGGLLVSAVRLRGLLAAGGHAIGTGPLFGDVVKSTALNALITVGSGEVYRTLQLRRRGLGAGESATAVVLDRVIGMAVIGAAGLIGAFAFGAHFVRTPLPDALVIGLGLAALVAAGWAARAAALRFAPELVPVLGRPRVLAMMLGCSVGVLVLWVMNVWLLAQALGIGVEPQVVMFAAPLVAIAALLPITLGGIGVREAGYALLLAPHGVEPGQAVALGLLQYCTYLVVAAIGGLLLVAERGRRPVADLPVDP